MSTSILASRKPSRQSRISTPARISCFDDNHNRCRQFRQACALLTMVQTACQDVLRTRRFNPYPLALEDVQGAAFAIPLLLQGLSVNRQALAINLGRNVGWCRTRPSRILWASAGLTYANALLKSLPAHDAKADDLIGLAVIVKLLSDLVFMGTYSGDDAWVNALEDALKLID